MRLGDEIRKQALTVKDGSLGWIRPQVRGSSHRMVAVGPPLYDGTSGIAVFLAALGRVLDDDALRRLGLQIVAPLRRQMAKLAADPDQAAGVRLRIGGLVGLGSFLYSFVTLAGLLDEPDLLEDAHRCTLLLTPERIRQDVRLDVFLGSAGTILSLLSLEAARRRRGAPTAGYLDLAQRCADHLLAAQASWEGHPRAWAAPDQPPMTGFSHGVAGIAYALLRLHALVGREELRQAALEGLEFERRFYLPDRRNWRDLRHREVRTMTSYCHGAPGIALGRLAISPLVDDAAVAEEIAIGLETTRRHGMGDFDFLCCGAMGRAEVLLRASEALGDPALRAAAEELAVQVLDRAERTRRFAWQPLNQDVFDPTLYCGAAGIGYTLLRLAAPHSIPSLLLVE